MARLRASREAREQYERVRSITSSGHHSVTDATRALLAQLRRDAGDDAHMPSAPSDPSSCDRAFPVLATGCAIVELAAAVDGACLSECATAASSIAPALSWLPLLPDPEPSRIALYRHCASLSALLASSSDKALHQLSLDAAIASVQLCSASSSKCVHALPLAARICASLPTALTASAVERCAVTLLNSDHALPIAPHLREWQSLLDVPLRSAFGKNSDLHKALLCIERIGSRAHSSLSSLCAVAAGATAAREHGFSCDECNHRIAAARDSLQILSASSYLSYSCCTFTSLVRACEAFRHAFPYHRQQQQNSCWDATRGVRCALFIPTPNA